ncbi:hypothetical protein, partial [Vibrio alginolyticus]|uniref:hypothetical protein n=1 Tax=Vibrio alginolyticus TaxID=663 RepID=UPI003D7D461A
PPPPPPPPPPPQINAPAPPRDHHLPSSSAASDVYKRQALRCEQRYHETKPDHCNTELNDRMKNAKRWDCLLYTS